MATHKHIDTICAVIAAFTLLLTILFIHGEALGITVLASEEGGDAMFTENDLNDAWDTAGATSILLSDAGATINGNGAYVYDGDVYIVYAGKYVLSGELPDGSIHIEAEPDDKIWLMLDGVTVHCEDGAALLIEQAEKVFLTLRGENTFSSGLAPEAETTSVDGTVYSRDDLTINGSGSLRVTAEDCHGIVCNDDLVLTGGTLTVDAAQDAIHANDSVRIQAAALTLTAGDDGIHVENDEETAYFYMESGSLQIPSCYEGVEAIQLTITGGVLDIASEDDGLNANGEQGNSSIDIMGGKITVTNENGRDADGLDSNRDIHISGGELLISVSDGGGNCAIDYGRESGGVCEISGGTVLACGGSGMAEGFDASSPQGFLMYTASAPAGTTVTLKTAEGEELLAETVPYSFSSVLLSAPETKVGETYTLAVGEQETELTVDNSDSQQPGANSFGGRGAGKQGGRGAGKQGGFGGMGWTPDGSAGTDGMQPPTPPDGFPDASQFMPGGETDGDRPADIPDDTPIFPQNGETIDRQGTPQRGERFPGDGEVMPHSEESPRREENASQTTDAQTSLSAEKLLLLGISCAVLLGGCLIALLYRKR